MKEPVVSFEIAKLAKEKGFPTELVTTHEAYNIKGDLGSIFYSNDIFDILAPTQSLLQKWLREKHNIHIEITLPVDDELKYCTPISFEFMVVYKNKDYYDGLFYDKYEEALEAALLKALQLIK